MADHGTDRRAGRRIRTQRGGRRKSGLIDEALAAPGAAVEAANRRARRNARMRIVVAAVVAVALVGGAVWWTMRPTEPDRVLPPDVSPTTDAGASLLIVVEDAGGRAASVALISAQSGGDARIMLFPPALVTVIPGFGERPLGDALRLGGTELTELTVTNLLGVRIDARALHDEASLAAALGSDVTLEMLDPYVVNDGSTETVLIAEGVQSVAPELAARLLVDPGVSDQLGWLVQQGAVWEGIAVRVAADAGTLTGMLATVEGDPSLADQALGNAAQAEGLLVTAVPVQRIAVGDDEAYAFDAQSPGDVVGGAFPYLALAPEPRVKVEILSGNDVIGSTRPVAARLIREGYRVLLTDNAANFSRETEIVAQAREFQEAAVAVQRLLGTGSVFLNVDQPSGVVDLTIIVGSDLSGS